MTENGSSTFSSATKPSCARPSPWKGTSPRVAGEFSALLADYPPFFDRLYSRANTSASYFNEPRSNFLDAACLSIRCKTRPTSALLGWSCSQTWANSSSLSRSARCHFRSCDGNRLAWFSPVSEKVGGSLHLSPNAEARTILGISNGNGAVIKAKHPYRQSVFSRGR